MNCDVTTQLENIKVKRCQRSSGVMRDENIETLYNLAHNAGMIEVALFIALKIDSKLRYSRNSYLYGARRILLKVVSKFCSVCV